MLNKIRAGIFFVAGLVLILFPKGILGMQYKVIGYLVKKFKINYRYSSKQGVLINRLFGLVFLVISAVLWVWG